MRPSRSGARSCATTTIRTRPPQSEETPTGHCPPGCLRTTTRLTGRHGANVTPGPKSLKKGGPDTTYVDPYPADCSRDPPAGPPPGEDPKYVAEIWWQIGNWEFDQLDFGGGVVKDEPAAVYDYNRAASAYHALA